MSRIPSALFLLTTAAFSLPQTGSSQNSPVLVTVETVQTTAIRETVQLTGSVTAVRAASLSPAIGGLVTTLKVDAGSRVSKGDVLLELDPELARWQVHGAEAAARAARVALEDARRRLAEARALAPQQSIAKTLVHDLAAEVAEDEATLQQAEADASYHRAILERHQLRAPFNGVIALKRVEVGEWVVPGDTVLELVATGELWIDFPMGEEYLRRVKPGASMSFTTGDQYQTPFNGKIATVVPVSDPDVRTFLLRVDPGSSTASLNPGMSVSGQVHLDAGRRAPLVPRDALIRYPDGRVIVWVVETKDGIPVVTERRVETGLVFDGMVEIRSGLAQGDLAVIRGNEALRPDQPVTMTGERRD